MINYDNNYIYLTVPTEYKCVYYNILDVLGNLGRDLLSACTATCKGRAINGIACYHMFNAACAAYYLGQVKLARTLISYIKAQLEISCDNLVIFQDSSLDEFVYLRVPAIYQTVFENLLSKMAVWGQELLDDCTASCSGNNKNILNGWNLFQAAITAYDYGNKIQSDKIVNFISTSLGINSDTEPVVQYYTISVNATPTDSLVTINGSETRTLTVEKNSHVTIVVSKAGYTTYTESFTATENRTLNVSLVREQIPDDEDRNVTIEVVTIPIDATVIINGNTGNTLSVPKGTPVNITVRKTGYITRTIPQFVATTDFRTTVELQVEQPQVRTATIAVVSTPSDALIKINGETRNTIELEIGQSCTMQVSKPGYKTQRKTITVEADYAWIVTLQQTNFSITPTDVNLSYTGGRVQFFAQENLEAGQVLMINNNANPTELKYYDASTNEEIQQDSLRGIDVPYFYTNIPQNNTNQAQIYRITAKDAKETETNNDETIDITIVVAANPNASGRSVITLNVAKDRNNNVLSNCEYYRNGYPIVNPPTEEQSFIIEFDSDPNSNSGVTLMVKKNGYAPYVINVDYKNGSQEINPVLDVQTQLADIYFHPLKYVAFSDKALYEEENNKFILIPYEDTNEQEMRVAFALDCCQVNSTDALDARVVTRHQNDGGIEIFNNTVEGTGEILVVINPYTWSSEEIELVVENNSNAENYLLKVPIMI